MTFGRTVKHWQCRNCVPYSFPLYLVVAFKVTRIAPLIHHFRTGHSKLVCLRIIQKNSSGRLLFYTYHQNQGIFLCPPDIRKSCWWVFLLKIFLSLYMPEQWTFVSPYLKFYLFLFLLSLDLSEIFLFGQYFRGASFQIWLLMPSFCHLPLLFIIQDQNLLIFIFFNPQNNSSFSFGKNYPDPTHLLSRHFWNACSMPGGILSQNCPSEPVRRRCLLPVGWQ